MQRALLGAVVDSGSRRAGANAGLAAAPARLALCEHWSPPRHAGWSGLGEVAGSTSPSECTELGFR